MSSSFEEPVGPVLRSAAPLVTSDTRNCLQVSPVDGKLYAAGGAPYAYDHPAAAGPALDIGSLNPADLISSDPYNQLVLGSDGKLRVPYTMGGWNLQQWYGKPPLTVVEKKCVNHDLSAVWSGSDIVISSSGGSTIPAGDSTISIAIGDRDDYPPYWLAPAYANNQDLAKSWTEVTLSQSWNITETISAALDSSGEPNTFKIEVGWASGLTTYGEPAYNQYYGYYYGGIARLGGAKGSTDYTWEYRGLGTGLQGSLVSALVSLPSGGGGNVYGRKPGRYYVTVQNWSQATSRNHYTVRIKTAEFNYQFI